MPALNALQIGEALIFPQLFLLSTNEIVGTVKLLLISVLRKRLQLNIKIWHHIDFKSGVTHSELFIVQKSYAFAALLCYVEVFALF